MTTPQLSIRGMRAHEVISSSGKPTLEVELMFSNGYSISSIVPVLDERDNHQRKELFDNEANRLSKKGMKHAAEYINQNIAPKLVGHLPYKQQDFDSWLEEVDGTEDKSKLGLNTMAAVSWVMAKAGAYVQGIPLFWYINIIYNHLLEEGQSPVSVDRIPTPLYTLVCGGKYGGDLDFEQTHLVPSSALSFAQSYITAVEVYQDVQNIFRSKNFEHSMCAIGGINVYKMNNEEVLDMYVDMLTQKNVKIGLDMFLGITCASDFYFKNNRYTIKQRQNALSTVDYSNWIRELCQKRSVLTLEDVFQKDDWDSWRTLFSFISEQSYLIGNTFTGIDEARALAVSQDKACSTVAAHPYTHGTVTEACKRIQSLRKKNLGVLIAAQEEESVDTFLADFAVGVQGEFIKIGGLDRGERVAKYNRLLHIEQYELAVMKKKG